MPAELAPPPVGPPPGFDELERAVSVARTQLDALGDRRRREATACMASWCGGHRAGFDEALGAIDRATRRLTETLALLALTQRRARDNGWPR